MALLTSASFGPGLPVLWTSHRLDQLMARDIGRGCQRPAGQQFRRAQHRHVFAKQENALVQSRGRRGRFAPHDYLSREVWRLSRHSRRNPNIGLRFQGTKGADARQQPIHGERRWCFHRDGPSLTLTLHIGAGARDIFERDAKLADRMSPNGVRTSFRPSRIKSG